MPLQSDFRRRLAEAVARVGRKQVTRADGTRRADEADETSISQGGLSKILSGERSNPGIFTIKAIADRAGVTVGELLGERGFDLTADDQGRVRDFIRWAEEKLLKAAAKVDARDTAVVPPPPRVPSSGPGYDLPSRSLQHLRRSPVEKEEESQRAVTRKKKM